MKNVFKKEVTEELVNRINQLHHETQPGWGKMNVAQMLAHCSVAYVAVFDQKEMPPIKGFQKFMLKLFVKNIVVGDKPYKKNSRTAPEFLIGDQRDFETEKERLINYMRKTQELGEQHFSGKESRSFGSLSSVQWNNMFYKHLDHHLTQFGV